MLHTPVNPLFTPATGASAGEAASRLGWVDVAKGLCIILVVMMHSTLGLGEALDRTGYLHAVVDFAQPFRMPAFFLISGLFLARTIEKPWTIYLDRKLAHFAYFYLLWTAIQCAAKILPTQGADDALGALAFALVQPFGVLWFIYLLPIFFVVTKLARRLPFALLFVAALLLNLSAIETGWIAVDEFAGRYVFFLIGYGFAPFLLALADSSRRSPEIGAVAVVAAFALVAAAAFSDGWTPANGASLTRAPILALALGIIGACALVGAAALLDKTRLGAGLRYCGRHSLAIYLAFVFPMAAMRVALARFNIAPDIIDVGTASVLITAVAIGLPLLFRHAVAGGPLGFLFERPRWARRSAPAPRLQPAE